MVASYIHGVSEQLRRVLHPTGMRWVNKAEPWARKVCSGIKDQVPNEKKTGVVYEIKCDDHQGIYIWEMLRSLKTCVDDHRQQS